MKNQKLNRAFNHKLKNLLNHLFIIAFAGFLVGCGATTKGVQVVYFSDNTKSLGKIVILNENNFSPKLRTALVSAGFSVPPLATAKTLTVKSNTLDRTFNNAAARLGIRHGGVFSSFNPCVTNRAAANFSQYQLEIIDLKNNETVLLLTNSGWTESCPGSFLTTAHSKDIFGDLAESLVANFNEIKLKN